MISKQGIHAFIQLLINNLQYVEMCTNLIKEQFYLVQQAIPVLTHDQDVEDIFISLGSNVTCVSDSTKMTTNVSEEEHV